MIFSVLLIQLNMPLPANKAIEAAYIQTGASSSVSQVQSYALSKVKQLDYNHIGAATIYAYKVYKDRKLALTIGENRVIVGLQSIGWEIKI